MPAATLDKLYLHQARIDAGQGSDRDRALAEALKESGFHWKDAVFFKRMEDASVRLRIFHPESHDLHALWTWTDRMIDAASWASIVVSVSEGDDTAERYKSARAFHGAS